MPRLDPMPRAQAREDIVRRYNQLFGPDVDPATDNTSSTVTGTPGNYTPVWANAPHARAAVFALPFAEGKMNPKLRELALMRTGYVVGSQFVYSQHCKMARDVGVEEPKIADIPLWQISENYTAEERTVLAYVDGLVLQQGRVHDRLFAALKKHMTPADIIELTYFTGTYITHATSCKALRLEYDDVPDRIVEIPTPETRRRQDWTDPSWAINQAKKNAEMK